MTPAARRVVAALRTLPDSRGWWHAGLIALAGIVLLLAVAFAAGLAAFRPVTAFPVIALQLPMLFFVPALGEEILFRALLVPPRTQPASLIRLALPVAAFVAWHPLQVVTFGPPWAGVFLDPWFLLCVAILGTVLTAQYRLTGSLWPCVLTHWAVVAGWKLLFAGPF